MPGRLKEGIPVDASAATELFPKDTVEDLKGIVEMKGMVAGPEEISLGRRRSRPPPSRRVSVARATHVVVLSLVGVADDLVRVGDLGEDGRRLDPPLLRRLLVGVVLQRQLSVRLLDFFGGGIPRHAQDGVGVISRFHCDKGVEGKSPLRLSDVARDTTVEQTEWQ